MIYSGNKSVAKPYSFSNRPPELNRPSSRSQLSLPVINKMMNKREDEIYKGRIQSIATRKCVYSTLDNQVRLNSPPKSKRSLIVKDINLVNIKFKQRLFKM